jgi:two-component system, chemotaxis family, response regulator Rcp1
LKKNINKPVKILIIENNPGDLHQLIEEFKKSTFLDDIRFTGSCREAWKMICQSGVFNDMPRPNMIIFDFNTLRNKGGSEVLERIIKEESIKCIPVVILTDLKDENELENYQDCPNLFITKPKSDGEYKNVVKCIEEFWHNYASNTKK